MVRVGPGQSGSGTDDSTDGGGGTDTTSQQTGRRGAVEQDDPEDVADGGGDGGNGGGTGGDTGGRQTGRRGAVEQDDPADVADGGSVGGGADDPANEPRRRAVDQTPDPGDGDTDDGRPTTDPIVSGVEEGGVETRQQLNRFTGPGVAAWEVEDRASDLEESVVERTGAAPSDIRIDLGPSGGLVPVFSEDFREEQREGREIDVSLERDMAIGGARAEVSAGIDMATREAEQQIEEQLGRDVEPGEDFVLTRTDEGFDVEFTEEFQQEQAARSVEERAGRQQIQSIFGPAAQIASGAASAVGADFDIPDAEDVPADVARQFSPIEAGQDFEITTETVTGTRATAAETAVDMLGLPSDGLPEEGDTYQDVEFTDSYREELAEAQQQTDPESMGFVEANLAGVEAILGPPGQLEGDIGGAVEGSAQSIIGAPGEVEQQTIGVVTGAPGQLERDIGGVVEGAAQPVLGPAGQLERDIGSATFTVADVSGDAAGWTVDNIVSPIGEVSGDIANVGQQSLEVFSPTTYIDGDSDIDDELTDVVTATFDVTRAPEDEQAAPTITESGTEAIVGGGLGLGAELTVGGPEKAVLLGDVGFSAAGTIGEEFTEEGWVGGAQTTAATAGTVGAAFAAGEARNIITNPFRATGEILAGGTIARGVERAATIGRARAETRGQEPFDLEDVGSQQAREGEVEVDRFQTDPGEPDAVAVEEIEQRAVQQPETVQEALDDPVLWRSDPTRGDFTDVGEGASELPGLFVTPDVPTLRLDTDIGTAGTASGGSLTPRIPFIGGATRPQRMAGFEATDVRSMPSTAAESAYAVYREGEPVTTGLSRRQARARAEGTDLQMGPDPTTAGFDFLTEDATAGTAYTRAAPDRTPELEAVYPPGTQFERIGAAGPVSIPGGRVGTADLYRRVDADVDAGDLADDVDVDAGDVDGETFTAQEITRRTSQTAPEGPPAVPVTTAPTSATDPVMSDYDVSTASMLDDTTTTTSTTTDISDTDVSATTGVTDPVSGLSSGTTTATTGTTTGTGTTGTSPTSTAPTTPTSPTTSPTEGTPTPTGPTSGGPTSTGPPTTGAPTLGGPTSGAPTTGGPPESPPPRLTRGDDDEELERFLEDETEEFDRLFEYDVVSPGEVLTGDDLGV